MWGRGVFCRFGKYLIWFRLFIFFSPHLLFFKSVHICYEVDFCQLSVSMQWYEVCCHKLSWFIVLSTLYFIIIIAYNLYFAYFLRIFSFTFFKDLFINLFIYQPLLFLLKKTLTYFKEIFQCCKYDPWWFVIACCTNPPIPLLNELIEDLINVFVWKF